MSPARRWLCDDNGKQRASAPTPARIQLGNMKHAISFTVNLRGSVFQAGRAIDEDAGGKDSPGCGAVTSPLLHLDRFWLTDCPGLFMLLCCALLAAGCNASYPPPELAAVGQGRPGWIDGHEDPRFLPPRYVAGVGLAKATKDVTADRKLADQNAFAEVAQQISVDVHARLSLQQLQVSTHKTNAFRDETRSDVTLASTITLNGLEIRERYSDPKGKIHYSLAVLDRVVAAESHHHALERHRKNYQAHLATFQKHRDNGEGYQALTSLREAFAEAGQYEDRLPAYQLLRGPLPPSGEVLFEPPSCAEVLDLLSDMLPRVRLDKIAGDNQQIIVGQPIPSPFIVRASLDGPTRLPMAGFPVVFRMTTGLGELSPTTSRTDEEGRAWS